MAIFTTLAQWCLLAQQRSVGEGALNGAVRGALIGGIIGAVVGCVMWAMKKFQKGSDKPPGNDQAMGG